MTEFFAVIIAESYHSKFQPLSSQIPKILFPLVDESLLEHQIQWLQKNQINEIIVLHQNEQIATYLNNRKNTGKKTQNIQQIHVLDSKSVGDALRELHSHKVIQKDFLLLYGDVMTNISLKEPIQRYDELKKLDSMNIMLMVVQQGKQLYEEERYFYVIDNQDRLCQLTDLTKSNVLFNKEKIILNKGIPCKYTIRSNLVESGIYVCSRDVLKSFQENFMFADIKEDFIKEMLTSEIQAEIIHVYIAPRTQISQRIFHPHSYHNACLKYVSRFFHPFCPKQQYYVDFYRYLIGKIDQNATVHDQSYVGQGSEVKGKAIINRSIIGKNCKIGQGSEIINSILWDNIIVNDNVVIKDCIISSNCTITVSVNDQIITSSGQENIDLIKAPSIIDHNLLEKSKQVEDSDSDEELGRHKMQKKDDVGMEEDMILLVQQCETKESVQQAITNVDTIKVNKNKPLEAIVAAFMPAFLNSLKPDVESLKKQFNVWEEFINRFVKNETEVEQQCYLKTMEIFCRQNQQFFLSTLLQLSYQNETLNEQVIINYHNEMANSEDEFCKQFVEINNQFKGYLENILEQKKQEEEGEYEYEYVYE